MLCPCPPERLNIAWSPTPIFLPDPLPAAVLPILILLLAGMSMCPGVTVATPETTFKPPSKSAPPLTVSCAVMAVVPIPTLPVVVTPSALDCHTESESTSIVISPVELERVTLAPPTSDVTIPVNPEALPRYEVALWTPLTTISVAVRIPETPRFPRISTPVSKVLSFLSPL